MSPPRKHGPRVPYTRYQQGVRISKRQPALGSVLIAIDIAQRKLNHRIDKAADRSQPRGSGSIVGSVVQVPQADPAHETAFEYLETVRTTLEQLVEDAPWT